MLVVYHLSAMNVLFQTPVLDEKTGKTKDKVTAFIVERAFGGVTRWVCCILQGIYRCTLSGINWNDSFIVRLTSFFFHCKN